MRQFDWKCFELFTSGLHPHSPLAFALMHLYTCMQFCS